MYQPSTPRIAHRATSVCDNSDGSAAQQGFDGSYDVFVGPASWQEAADDTHELALFCGDLHTGVLEHVDTAQVPVSANARNFNARRSLDGCQAVFVSLELVPEAS